MAEIKAGQLAQLLATLPANMPVILEGNGPVTDWRGEVRDGQNVLVLYAGKAPEWRPANNGSGKYRWFLVKDDGHRTLYHYRADGNLKRFASPETAQRAADRLNAQVQS